MNTDKIIKDTLNKLDAKKTLPELETKRFLAALFLEYVNNFITTEKFCEHLGNRFSVDEMQQILRNGKDCFEMGYLQEKAL